MNRPAASIASLLLTALLATWASNARAETIWVGVTPWQKGQSGDDINRLYVPLLKYLTENTGADFKIKPMPSYEGTADQIASGTIQVAMISPAPYVKAKRANPKLEILVTELSWNHDKTLKRDSYQSHILVKADRADLTSIESLKGKKFAFVSEESTSGYVVPLAHLREKKIDYKTYFFPSALPRKPSGRNRRDRRRERRRRSHVGFQLEASRRQER